MRLSTLTIQENALAAMQRQQSRLAETQSEVATGRRIRSPADDPIGASRLIELDRSLSASTQFGKNATMATNRLQFAEQSIADATQVVQRLQELALQANSGVLGDAARRSIAVEIRQRAEEMLTLANRRDGSGEFLFAGTRTSTEPFSRAAGGVLYQGDEMQRLVQVSMSQRVLDGVTGREVFLDVPQGNGVFTTRADPANTGSAAIDVGVLANASAWVPDDYVVRFTSATAYEVLDGAGTNIAAGTFVAGTGIEFRGVRITLDGVPAAGDRFEVSTAGREDVFSTLDRLARVVGSPVMTAAERARFSGEMGSLIQQLGQAIDHMSNARATVGARLSAVERSEAARANLDLELQQSVSELRDVDYASAVTRMNLQLVALQAAQQSYSRIAQLSLFNYL